MHITDPLPREKNARLVFGLEWRAYPSRQMRAERRRYADDFGATHYVEYRIGKDVIGGFCAPEMAEIKGAKLYSGAARIAQHDRVKGKAAVVVLLQDDQRVHVVFVVRGVVRSDEVLTVLQARDRKLAIEQECLKLNLALTTLGSGPGVGDVDESFGAAALLDARRSARVSKVPASVPSIVPIFVIGAALVFGGMQLADVLNPPAPPAPREPSFEEKYAALVRQTFAAKMPRANLLAPALLATLGNSETVVGGWVFEKAVCGTQGYCAEILRRYGGSFDDLRQVAPEAMRPLHFDADGLHAGARGPQIPAVAFVADKDQSTWPTEQGLIDALQTPPQKLSAKPFELDSYGYTVHLEPAKPLLAVPMGTTDSRPAQMIRVGEWTISGLRWQSPLLARLPPNMTLDTMTVALKLGEPGASRSQNGGTDVQNGIHFTARGKYYVLN
ncbi:hypothetical protein R75461_07389 [Paraburkholderia nemoris]|uniref:hypothetical protein n=1 Tax=Paraburkholderia nemoris TaxID=2793076 RepID=UPI00190B9881|nr:MULTISPECIES: hypothetical protein [Paraburkholderia]MBK3786230.1 hypothetical protein [Paraburkholderia aspalathi]CAE6849239.1 hypothetical protein R75461_07389 [Paraburkholderia nemoris]